MVIMIMEYDEDDSYVVDVVKMMIKVVVMVLLVITSPICYPDQIYLSMILVFL